MLQQIRRGAQSFTAKIVALLICFVLVVFGFGAFNLFNLTQPAAAVVYGDKITLVELESEMESRWRAALTNQGPDIDPAQIGTVQHWLEQLIDHRLLIRRAKELRIQSSRDKYLAMVQSMMGSRADEITKDEFARIVASEWGLTLQGLENIQRNQELVDMVWALVYETGFATESEFLDHAKVARQSRDVAYLIFSTSLYTEEVEMPYEEVTEYYRDHAQDYLTEETFDLSYVVLDKSKFIADHEVTEEEILAVFEAESADSTENAERKARHILLKVDDNRTEEEALAGILEFKEQIAEGASFADLASEHSEDAGSAIFGGDLGFYGRGIFVPEFEEALFNLNIGEISEPVVTQYGVHLIELLEIQEVEPVILEDRYEEIKQELLEELATPEYEENVTLLGELAFEHIDSLDYIAETLDLTVEYVPGVTREFGFGVFEKDIVRNLALVDDVVVNGFNSEPIQVDDRSVLVAHLVSSTPPSVRPLEEVRDQIREAIREEKAAAIALNNRNAAYASIQESGDFSGIDQEYGVEWFTVDRMGRFQNEVPSDIRTKSFSVQLGDNEDRRKILIADGHGNDKAIVVVSAVYEGQFTELTAIEQEAIKNNSRFDVRDLDIRGMMETVRQRGKVQRKLTDEAVWRPGTGIEMRPSG